MDLVPTGFADINEFGRYAFQTGQWAYDNGWNYQGEYYSAYVALPFGREQELSNSLLMLRNETGQTVMLHRHNGQLIEIWSGQVESKEAYDAAMIIVEGYVSSVG